MNDQNQPPFNPIPLPAELTLGQSQETTHQQARNPGAEQGKQTSRSKTRRRPRKAKAPQLETCDPLTRWERIKGKLAARVAQIDRESLRKVLLACGVAVGVVAAVLLLVKMMPAALTLLALLGIALVIKIWDRLRYFPRPF